MANLTVWKFVQSLEAKGSRTMMKSLLCGLLVAASFAGADTLELASGTILEGTFTGSSNGIIMFDTGNGLEAFPHSKVVAIYLSAGVATAEAEQVATVKEITIPAGTRLVLRTTDTVDTDRHGAGHRFRAQLESAVVIDGVTVIPRHAYLHGRVESAGQARRVAGSAELSIAFTDVMIDDQLFRITTGELSAQTSNEARRTVGRTARAAAVGGLFGGRSGARTGAAVGASASILTRGASINIPRGTILETSLAAALTVPK